LSYFEATNLAIIFGICGKISSFYLRNSKKQPIFAPQFLKGSSSEEFKHASTPGYNLLN